MIGNEEDFTACLGFEVPGVDPDLSSLPTASFRAMIGEVAAAYPNFAVVATTLRARASRRRSTTGARSPGRTTTGFVEATQRPGLEILDRVGGGDSFASGLIYGLLTTNDLGRAVEYGAAHGALAMTTPGDTSTARLEDVERLVERPSARMQR